MALAGWGVRGQRSITAARRNGLKPGVIFFDVDLTPVPQRFWFQDPENALHSKQHARVEMSLGEDWRTADLRFVAGCTVILCADAWSDGLVDLAEKIAANGAARILAAALAGTEILTYHCESWTAHA